MVFEILYFFIAECSLEVPPADMALYNECKETVQSLHLNKLLVKVLSIVATILLVVAVIVAYFLIKRRQRRNKKLKRLMESKINGQMLT